MSEANRVLWSEGLFLRTQHFQQQDRFFETMARGTLQAGRLQTFGFRSLTLDPSLLEAGQIAVLSARGIFPDGTPFAIPETMDAPQAAGGHLRDRGRRGADRAAPRAAGRGRLRPGARRTRPARAIAGRSSP